jgi:hypothetical protein
MPNFDSVASYITNAKAIAWDTCHKIYLLMDDEQVAKMREYEYDPLITDEQMSPQQMFTEVTKWYDESCFLKFVDAVSTNPDDQRPEFTSLIAQGEDSEYDDDDWDYDEDEDDD